MKKLPILAYALLTLISTHITAAEALSSITFDNSTGIPIRIAITPLLSDVDTPDAAPLASIATLNLDIGKSRNIQLADGSYIAAISASLHDSTATPLEEEIIISGDTRININPVTEVISFFIE